MTAIRMQQQPCIVLVPSDALGYSRFLAMASSQGRVWFCERSGTWLTE